MADERRIPKLRRGRPPVAPEGRPPPPGRDPGGRGTPKEKPPMLPFSWRRFIAVLAVLLFLNYAIVAIFAPPEKRKRIPYTPTFIQEVQKGNVKEISSRGETLQGDFRKEFKDANHFETEVPTFADTKQLSRLLQEHKVTVNAKPPSERSFLQTLIFSFGPTLLIVGLFIFLIRRAAQAGGGGMLGQFGRSKARLAEASEQRVTFDDVAGIDEAKNELTEIVEFLKEPERFMKLGARMPRGVLLSGLPGTGKTLLAKAVAGEAGVPFFSGSASEFIEAIVGVGASRVRDLFQKAKKVAPSIVFIDELDAIGRARGGAFSAGGVDEREQTLNQILTEMDGFQGNEGVVVLAATNRSEVLDPALLRPGRFDRRVTVSPPDFDGRLKILQVHTRKVPLAPEVDLTAVAAATPGLVGADLANLVNEAALAAAQHGHDRVTGTDLGEAVEKVLLGTVRGIVLSPEEKLSTAYHESGHALLGMLTPGADPVRRVTIIPRGQALGVTVQTPQMDRYGYTEKYLRGRITGALGGRAAEDIVYGEVSTGAESDLEQATALARRMVSRWGMSTAIGPVSVLPPPGQEQPFGGDGVAPATKQLVDEEVRRLIEDCYGQAVSTLRGNRDKLDRLAHTLLERETLGEDEAYAAAGVPRASAPAAVARGEVPGIDRAPGLPPVDAA